MVLTHKEQLELNRKLEQKRELRKQQSDERRQQAAARAEARKTKDIMTRLRGAECCPLAHMAIHLTQ